MAFSHLQKEPRATLPVLWDFHTHRLPPWISHRSSHLTDVTHPWPLSPLSLPQRAAPWSSAKVSSAVPSSSWHPKPLTVYTHSIILLVFRFLFGVFPLEMTLVERDCLFSPSHRALAHSRHLITISWIKEWIDGGDKSLRESLTFTTCLLKAAGLCSDGECRLTTWTVRKWLTPRFWLSILSEDGEGGGNL